jgi:hypothetical protein
MRCPRWVKGTVSTAATAAGLTVARPVVNA